MASDVAVSIVEVVSKEHPPASTVRYEVRNAGTSPVWLVADDWLVWRQDGEQIILSLARGRMQPGVEVFGYFDPAVEPLAPARSLTRALTLSWPLELSRIWNAARSVAPEPGTYTVRVEVGYGRTPAPARDPEADAPDVETPVLRWQETASSPPAVLVIPDWREQPGRSPP